MPFPRSSLRALLVGLLASLPASVAAQESFPVSIHVDAGHVVGKAEPIWRFFGADEPNYATMKDGRALLDDLGKLSPGHVYFRAHNLMTSGDGTPALKWGSTNMYSDDAQGRPIYSWTIVDRIFDTYLQRGVKPYVELGFMPEALSTHPQPYQHAWRPGLNNLKTGWAYPPKDYAKWDELVYQWIRHCIDRYGRDEVRTWYFETWNEANLPQYYWGGTREEFFKLHDTTVRAIRRALPDARIGGPDMAGANDDFLTAFMTHEEAAGIEDDFVSFHAKGSPTFIDDSQGGHIRMGIATELQVADREFANVAANPAFKSKPVIIGEADPEGCAACQGPTNAYRNGTMYSSYEAAVLPRLAALAGRRDIKLQGTVTWAFEYEDQRYFAGFRQLSTNGIALPVLNVFRMYAMMGPERLDATSDHALPLDAILAHGVRNDPDVGVSASRDGEKVTIMVWHYHDEDVPGPAAHVSLQIDNLPKGLSHGGVLTQYRVDDRHSNSFAAYQAMGSPLAPTAAQYDALAAAGNLASVSPPQPLSIHDNSQTITFDLPRQGVALIILAPPPVILAPPPVASTVN
jgi:xylan 1,4-beta-xylosidase